MLITWRTVPHMIGQMKSCFAAVSVACLLTRLFHPVSGGHCWEDINNQGVCGSLYRRNVSREECCQNTGASMAWSPQDSFEQGRLFYLMIVGGGVPGCQRCHDTCTNVQCGRSRQCRMRRGTPRCVCAPDCSSVRHRHRSWVCATNQQSYRSHCSLLRYNCRNHVDYTVDYYGKCQRSCSTVQCRRDLYCIEDQDGLPHCIPCQVNCPANSNAADKVCGVNGVTYDSFCHLFAASCIQGKSIGKAYDGECRGLTCADLTCPHGRQCLNDAVTSFPSCLPCGNHHRCLQLNPARQICGSDDSTYSSYCAMRRYSCRTGRSVTTKHSGSCSESPHGALESSFLESEGEVNVEE